MKNLALAILSVGWLFCATLPQTQGGFGFVLFIISWAAAIATVLI